MRCACRTECISPIAAASRTCSLSARCSRCQSDCLALGASPTSARVVVERSRRSETIVASSVRWCETAADATYAPSRPLFAAGVDVRACLATTRVAEPFIARSVATAASALGESRTCDL